LTQVNLLSMDDAASTGDRDALLPEGWTAREVTRGGRTCIEARTGTYTVEVDDRDALARAIADYRRYGAGTREPEPRTGGRP
jgi:hypothetical protein